MRTIVIVVGESACEPWPMLGLLLSQEYSPAAAGALSQAPQHLSSCQLHGAELSMKRSPQSEAGWLAVPEMLSRPLDVLVRGGGTLEEVLGELTLGVADEAGSGAVNEVELGVVVAATDLEGLCAERASQGGERNGQLGGRDVEGQEVEESGVAQEAGEVGKESAVVAAGCFAKRSSRKKDSTRP